MYISKKYLFIILWVCTVAFAATDWGDRIIKGSLTLSGLTATTVPYLNSSKVVTSSAVTPTELGYLSGVTSAVQTQLDGKLSALAGTVIMYAGSSCPTGTIAADGSAVSRTVTYDDLFAVVGEVYGVGDGSSTFNVPDARGVFVRGKGSQTISAIVYTGTAGTTQGDTFQGHYHTITNTYSLVAQGADSGTNAGRSNSGSVVTSPQGITAAITDGTNGTPRTGTETRPANITLLFCIYY